MLKITDSYELSPSNFIDGTLIINKCGIENVGYGCGESCKKKYILHLHAFVMKILNRWQ